MKAPIRVLLLEDNANDAELLRATLQRGAIECRIVRVETEPTFRKALDEEFDLIISDFTLPSFDGKSALALAKERQPDVPFIFVSGTIGEEAAIESLVGGATDYVLKHKFSRLLPAVRRALNEKQEQRARREAERQLQITLEQLKNLFDNLDQVFFSFDPRDHKLLQISPACQKVYGLPPQAFFDNPQFWKNVATSDDGAVITAAESSLRAGESVSCEYRTLRADRAIRWVFLRMKPVRDAAGKTIRVDGLVADITERKELEAQFLRAQRLDNLGSLAGGIAHDLNNVLAPIVMGVEVLREQHTDRHTLSTLSTLELCAKRGANLVKQILMFARGVEGRRTELEPARSIFDLEKMLQRTFPKSIRISTDVAPDLWTISANKTQLEQVLMNLCVNARDAMPDGGNLTISACNQQVDSSSTDRKASHVVIEVSDMGEGIPPENVEKIFDPFFTTKQAGMGTGLGLSTVNAIVKSHGGHITVKSSLGQGTVFQVHLPALSAGTERPENLRANDFPSGQGELVLVVDDEAAIRDLARTVLENYGYRVLVAPDGTEALKVYAEHRNEINLVVTDTDMPGMTGTQLIQRIGEMNADVRVICTSGLMDASAMPQTPTHSNIRATLQKPFSPAQLLQTMRDVLQSK